jgi:hypothetical protein
MTCDVSTLATHKEGQAVQVNACLASGCDFTQVVDFSMKQDATRVMRNGKRIVKCMIRYTLTLPAFRLPR